MVEIDEKEEEEEEEQQQKRGDCFEWAALMN